MFIKTLIAFFQQRRVKPAFPVSRLPPRLSFSLMRSWYSSVAFFCALFFMLLALVNPTSRRGDATKRDIPREGDAFFLLIDISSSMGEKVIVDGIDVKKIDLTKQAARELIERSSPGSLIGLTSFARVATVLSPLTLDHQALLRQLDGVEPVGTEALDGTSIGYAIFKTVNLLIATKYYAEKEQEKGALFSLQKAAVVVLTDGLQSPHPHDSSHPFRFIRTESALQYAEQHGVRVYLVEVDPVMNSEQFRQENERLRGYVERTGGAFFVAQQDLPVTRVLESIEELQQGASYREVHMQQVPQESFAPVSIAIAGIFFCIAVLLETVIVRQAP